MAEKRQRTERNESNIDTEDGGEASQRSIQSQSRHKEGHMRNLYLTDSDKKTVVDFVEDHEELYNKINENFKDKVKKDCL